MWKHAAALAWWEEARRGCVWTPDAIAGDGADALRMAIRYRNNGPDEGGTLYVDSHGGDSSCWDLAVDLERGHWNAFVRGFAISAGLILTVACNGHRKCLSNSVFNFHGLELRHPEHDDRRRARWYAQRTRMPEDFWLSYCEVAGVTFGAEQALEWGVVHEIVPGGPRHYLDVEV